MPCFKDCVLVWSAVEYPPTLSMKGCNPLANRTPFGRASERLPYRQGREPWVWRVNLFSQAFLVRRWSRCPGTDCPR